MSKTSQFKIEVRHNVKCMNISTADGREILW